MLKTNGLSMVDEWFKNGSIVGQMMVELWFMMIDNYQLMVQNGPMRVNNGSLTAT